MRNHFYKVNKKSFVYHKKDDVEEFENRFKKTNEMYKEFDKNIDKFFEQEMKNPNKKPHKPIRITYVDMKNKKKKNEFFMENEQPTLNPNDSKEIKENNSSNSSVNDNTQKLAGLNDKFPEENFIQLDSTQGFKKIKLHTYRYPAKGSLKGIVYLLHGLFEHSNSNANIAKILSEHGYDVLSFDMRGHGKSEGKRGYLESKKVMLEDLKNFIDSTDKLYKDKTQNKFVLGNSLGGLYANLISLEFTNYFNGMVMIAPPLLMETKKYDIWLKIANVLRHFIPSLPLMRIKFNIENKALTDYFKSDPLIYKGRLRVGTGLAILDSVNYSSENIDKVSTPFYLIHGAQDKDCNPKGSTKFYEKAKLSDKTYILHDNYDHFITRHPDIDKLATDMAFWMDMHLK